MPKATKKQLQEELTPIEASEVMQPRVYLPATKAQVDELEVGKKATLVIKGKVKHLSSSEDEEGTRGNIEIEIDSSEVYGKNEYREMAEDAGVIDYE